MRLQALKALQAVKSGRLRSRQSRYHAKGPWHATGLLHFNLHHFSCLWRARRLREARHIHESTSPTAMPTKA
ncbi:MAG: hypothetical protein DESF_01598 [Desulfovibrio sp.]